MISSLYSLLPGSLIIYGHQGSKPRKQYFSFDEMETVSLVNSHSYSTCVEEFSWVKWTEMYHLYFLASFIHKNFPDNKFDWIDQFTLIENSRLNEKCKKEYQEKNNYYYHPNLMDQYSEFAYRRAINEMVEDPIKQAALIDRVNKGVSSFI